MLAAHSRRGEAMKRFGSIALLLCLACSSEGRDGPALYPRPETQTCLASVTQDMPALLSETGCFVPVLPSEPGEVPDEQGLAPAPELIPYEVNAALWSDGTYKPRFMVVPKPERILLQEDGTWLFPEGSILIKSFGFEFEKGNEASRRLVETRFMRLRRGQWEFSTYRWNDEGSDAELLSERTTVRFTLRDGDQTEIVDYGFPEEGDCRTCHGTQISSVLGVKTAQLNREHDYDGVTANQLQAMDEIDLLEIEAQTELDPESMPRMANPTEGEGSLQAQARAYLDANCAHCHQPNGWASSDIMMDLRHDTALADSGLCDLMLFAGWKGIPRIAAGDPEGSGLLQRMWLDNEFRMPSLAVSRPDERGIGVIEDWVSELEECP